MEPIAQQTALSWPHARVIGSFGRSVAPAPLVEEPIRGRGPLVVAREVTQLGELALVADGVNVDAIDLATGTHTWRAPCPGTPVPRGERIACDRVAYDRTGKQLDEAPVPPAACSSPVADWEAVGCDANTVTIRHDHTVAVYARRPVKPLQAISFDAMWTVGGELAIATHDGLIRASMDLAKQRVLPLHVEALLAQLGTRQVVRTAERTVLVLDDDRVRAQLPAAEHVAIGTSRVWLDGRLYRLPEVAVVKRPAPAVALTLAAELRDLPVVTEPSGEIASGLDGEVRAVALAGTELYAASEAGLAAFDLVTRTWTWKLALPGVRALAASPGVIVALAGTDAVGIIDGKEVWRRAGTGQVSVSYDTVVVGSAVLAADGTPIGTVPGPAVALDGLVIGVEHDQLVARLSRGGLLPVWALRVRGEVAAIEATRDGALVTMTDHDAYLVDRLGAVTALPGFAEQVKVAGALVIATTRGGPIPPDPIVPPKLPPEVYHPTDLETAPAIATPWPPPPPMPASTQLTFYGLDAGLRARNDYAVDHAELGVHGGGAPVVFSTGGMVFEIDASTGTPLRRVEAPGEGRIIPFATVVDQKSVAGMIVGRPLRLSVF